MVMAGAETEMQVWREKNRLTKYNVLTVEKNYAYV